LNNYYLNQSILPIDKKAYEGGKSNADVIVICAAIFDAFNALNSLGKGTGEILPSETNTVYRVWGDDSAAWGHSWTTVDPSTIANYRDFAGLPDLNTGRFISVGQITDPSGISMRAALALDGNAGGLSELLIPDPFMQIELNGVYGINPKY